MPVLKRQEDLYFERRYRQVDMQNTPSVNKPEHTRNSPTVSKLSGKPKKIAMQNRSRLEPQQYAEREAQRTKTQSLAAARCPFDFRFAGTLNAQLDIGCDHVKIKRTFLLFFVLFHFIQFTGFEFRQPRIKLGMFQMSTIL